jgi:hypothetical protein
MLQDGFELLPGFGQFGVGGPAVAVFLFDQGQRGPGMIQRGLGSGLEISRDHALEHANLKIRREKFPAAERQSSLGQSFPDPAEVFPGPVQLLRHALLFRGLDGCAIGQPFRLQGDQPGTGTPGFDGQA